MWHSWFPNLFLIKYRSRGWWWVSLNSKQKNNINLSATHSELSKIYIYISNRLNIRKRGMHVCGRGGRQATLPNPALLPNLSLFQFPSSFDLSHPDHLLKHHPHRSPLNNKKYSCWRKVTNVERLHHASPLQAAAPAAHCITTTCLLIENVCSKSSSHHYHHIHHIC